MATQGAGKPSCAETGLAVPECSCRRCLEQMLAEHSPAIVAAEIRVVATARSDGPPGRREAA